MVGVLLRWRKSTGSLATVLATVHWLPLAGAQGGAAATTWWVTHTPTDHRPDSEIVYALVWFQFLIFCTQPLAGA